MAINDKYEEELEGIWFAVSVNREEHMAFISAKALDEHFNARQVDGSYATAYRRHRARIHAVARQKSSCLHDYPKQILLRSTDF